MLSIWQRACASEEQREETENEDRVPRLRCRHPCQPRPPKPWSATSTRAFGRVWLNWRPIVRRAARVATTTASAENTTGGYSGRPHRATASPVANRDGGAASCPGR